MSKLASLPKERIIEAIVRTTNVGELMKIRKELLNYGFSEDGVLIYKVERRKLELQGKDPGPEKKWPGEDLPPIIGEFRG